MYVPAVIPLSTVEGVTGEHTGKVKYRL